MKFRMRRIWIEAEIRFEPRDIWVGVYWKAFPSAVEFYVCLVPMLPIYLYAQRYQ